MKRHVGLLVIALVIAACGGAGEGADDPSDPDGTDATQAQPNGGGDEDTLAGFFGWDDFDDTQWRDDEARRQELIRQCMAEQGFDYIPIQQPDVGFSVAFDEEEFARTQGFGITTWFDNEEEFFGPDFEDPNQEIVEGMSDSEREAFYAALYGTEEDWEGEMITEVDPETGEEFQYVEGGWGFGCEGQASEQVWGDTGGGNELWEELGPQMEAMWERVQADPRIVELNDEWSECMAGAGYNVNSQQDLWDWEGDGVIADLQRRFDELVGDYWSDPFDGWSEAEIEAFFEEKSQDEIETFFRDAEEASRGNVDQEAVAALQQEEIELAVANFECSQEVDWNDVYQEISQEYERDFIAANRGVLEQIREAQGG